MAAAALTTDSNDVLVYRVGGATPVETVALDSDETAQPRGLAWTGDLDRLFVVTRRGAEPAPRLEVVRDPV